MFPPSRRRTAVNKNWSPGVSWSRSTSDSAVSVANLRNSKPARKASKSPLTPSKRFSTLHRAAPKGHPPLRRKPVGFRRVLSRTSDKNKACNSNLYEHGLRNPIIKTLILSNPQTLGRILSVRDPISAVTSDYIFSLLSSTGQNEIVRDKSTRKRSTTDITTSDTLGVVGQKGSTKRRQATENAGQQFEIPFDNNEDKGDEETLSDNHNDEFAFITRDEIVYLADVLEEKNHYDKRHATGIRDSSRSTGVIRNDASKVFKCVNTESISKEEDDLTWLTQEMERDWLRFLHNTEEIGLSDARDPNATAAGQTAPKGKYCYKASIMLTKQTRCDLGSFVTPDGAARAYDRNAIARSTLSKKLAQELDLRRRTKARRMAYQEMERALLVDNVTPDIAAERAVEAATEASNLVTSDDYLLRPSVLKPELNTPEADSFFNNNEQVDQTISEGQDKVHGTTNGANDSFNIARESMKHVMNVAGAMLDGGAEIAGLALDMTLREIVPVEREAFAEKANGGGGKCKEANQDEGGDSLEAVVEVMQSDATHITTRLLKEASVLERLIKIEKSMEILHEEGLHGNTWDVTSSN